MTPDELWEKYRQYDGYVLGHDFLAALAEYGESVRQQAVRVCREMGETTGNLNRSAGQFDCADAIEKMPLT